MHVDGCLGTRYNSQTTIDSKTALQTPTALGPSTKYFNTLRSHERDGLFITVSAV